MLGSDATGTNKPVPNARAKAWPMQGGLQSITNTGTVRTQTGPIRGYEEVATKQSVDVVPEASKVTNEVKTPSPSKVTIKVEPASGKENMSATA